MLQMMSVNFDNHIPHWRTQLETITHNVLVVVREGQVRYEINGNVVTAEAEDVLFIPKGARRAGENMNGVPHQKFTVLFTCETGVQTGIPFVDKGHFVKFKLSSSQYAYHRCERLYDEMRSGRNYRSIICLGILQELLGMIARELDRPTLTPSKLKYAETIKAYLLEHYREQIEISQLAALIGRSPNYITAVFKEVCGLSPIRYMHQLRMLEAYSLLLGSDMTVADISQYLGYYDTSYFHRVFKKHCGLSPTEYAAQANLAGTPLLFS
ncbi:helix-turn-helix domain-containing protein [Paenibacillus sp. DMB20]|uniref:helix-turn-helix domain-containing protein n=1 Tax=Paenibacillus sp. DMB20 TaxID=1642570 RepID=UPI0006278040|nr:AraC family transcriptional regulator [Paenibacillus sp. DMB20]KKO55329.1 AraC family transcriptional regulator [Paenibacillus sp. DMB20]